VSEEPSSSTPPSAGVFATTRWTVVMAAGGTDSPTACAALEALCAGYWYPLYVYVRRQGHGPHDAQDLTQAFFARLLEKNYLADVQREKGRFRSFLLASLKHFLANEWDRERALKRGGGRRLIALDDDSAESRYKLEPKDELSADKIFERRWALTLLDKVLSQLRAEYEHGGKAEAFEILKPYLSAGRTSVPYAHAGEKLRMNEGAVKVAVHRLRKRYRELLRAEIAQTVSTASEIEAEIRYLFAALSS
jgi:DNA-directed RNA polymerase specialized sigma24 family protein